MIWNQRRNSCWKRAVSLWRALAARLGEASPIVLLFIAHCCEAQRVNSFRRLFSSLLNLNCLETRAADRRRGKHLADRLMLTRELSPLDSHAFLSRVVSGRSTKRAPRHETRKKWQWRKSACASVLELCVLNFKSESRTQGQWHFISSPCDSGIVTANFGRSTLRLCVLSLTCGALLCGVEWIKKQTQLQRRGAKLEFFYFSFSPVLCFFFWGSVVGYVTRGS